MADWVGVDLDGVLAEADGWQGLEHIGQPVPAMIRRVRGWLADGLDVRVFTARANPFEQTPEQHAATLAAIQAWCLEHVGRELPIEYAKDRYLQAIFDDRAVGVEVNTGRLVVDFPGEAVAAMFSTMAKAFAVLEPEEAASFARWAALSLAKELEGRQ